MNPFTPNVVDFIERVAATAFEAGAAVYMVSPHAADVKVALVAAGLAALKYVALKVTTWQASHAG